MSRAQGQMEEVLDVADRADSQPSVGGVVHGKEQPSGRKPAGSHLRSWRGVRKKR